MKGLQKEVKNLPEHTGVEEIIAQIMSASDKLHEEKDLEPQLCFRKSPESRRLDSRDTNQPSDPRLLPRIWGCRQR
jgi:hypothetical protein